MFSFFKKDILVFWRDRKEVAISLLAPILIIIVLNFAFSGITFDDAGDMEISAGLVLEDDEAAGIQEFETSLQEMNLSEIEIEAMMNQATSLSPHALLLSLFDEPDLGEIVHTNKLTSEEATTQLEDGELDAVIKLPEGFTSDVLHQIILDQPADTTVQFQIEEHSLETNILSDIIDNYLETLNFQFALGAVTEGVPEEAALPQGGREVMNESAIELDLAQYYTMAMSTLFALFIAATVAAKTETEKRERVFNRILLTNSRPILYLMGKVISTFLMTLMQLMLVFVITDLLLGIFPDPSIDLWLGIIIIAASFSLVVASMSAAFTALLLRMNNLNAAQGLFTMFIMLIAALGGNFFVMDQFPEWLQGMSEWTPTGVTMSLFTDFLQGGNAVSFTVPLLKQAGFFIVFLLIGILLFPERRRA